MTCRWDRYPSFCSWDTRGCCGIARSPGKFQESEACLGDRRSSRTGCGGSEAVVGREVLRTLLGARRAPAGFSTEKIEHESAAAGRNWDSPVPLNRTNSASDAERGRGYARSGEGTPRASLFLGFDHQFSRCRELSGFRNAPAKRKFSSKNVL